MQFRDLYVVLWAKIKHSSNYKQWKMPNNPLSWCSLKTGATKRTWLRWKPIHSLTSEYWIFMELSHTVGIFVCEAAGVVSKYFLFLCLLNALSQIMQVSNTSWKSLISVWLNIAIPKISCDHLSGEEVYSIHWICPVYVWRSWDMDPCASLACCKWFQLHSLNMSSVCLKILRHGSMCIIGLLQMISVTLMASGIDCGELLLISSLA
jgi:hypothetical protein